jgi:hypothetical protein
MTTVTCDICKKEITYPIIKVTVPDGEHPHNGATMYETIDCCKDCISNIPALKSNTELSELRK